MRVNRGDIVLPSHAFLPAGAGGLTQDSVAPCEQIRVIHKRRITKILGHLDLHQLSPIEQALRTILGL